MNWLRRFTGGDLAAAALLGFALGWAAMACFWVVIVWWVG